MDLSDSREGLRGYALCGQPRCGSTYLARLCGSTGVLGRPREYFAGVSEARSANTDPEGHLRRWVERTMSPNGVYGLKIFAEQFDLVKQSRWAERLPNLVHIHLHRRDVLGQAISLVRARQALAFKSGQEEQQEPVYSRRSIAQMLEQIAFGQARWTCWFGRNGITPLHLAYEDIAADPRGAVRLIADMVGVDAPPPVEPPIAIQRDQLSEAWRERFISESADLSWFDYPSERVWPRIRRLIQVLR